MGLKDVAKVFDFAFPTDFADLQFSDTTKIRNDPATSTIVLKKTGGVYPTDADVFVRTPLLNPTALSQWSMLDARFTTPTDTLNSPVTSVQWRLNDGTDDLYWNGSAWVVAGASDWNTLNDVQDHFPSFPTTSQKLRVVANLKTTDETRTPVLDNVRVLYRANVDSFLEEVIYRSLVPALRTNVRPSADMVVKWGGGLTLDLDTLTFEDKLSFTAGVAAYNYDTDPQLTSDLLDSYDPNTRVVTLLSDPGSGANVLLRLAYKPVVAVSTHPDYDEIERIPAIVVQDIVESFAGRLPVETTFVRRSDGSGKALRAPRQVTYTLQLRSISARALDMVRLAEAVQSYLINNTSLKVASIDQSLDTVMVSDPALAPKADDKHMHESIIGVKLIGADKWLYPATDGYGVQTIQITGDEDFAFNLTIT